MTIMMIATMTTATMMRNKKGGLSEELESPPFKYRLGYFLKNAQPRRPKTTSPPTAAAMGSPLPAASVTT